VCVWIINLKLIWDFIPSFVVLLLLFVCNYQCFLTCSKTVKSINTLENYCNVNSFLTNGANISPGKVQQSTGEKVLTIGKSHLLGHTCESAKIWPQTLHALPINHASPFSVPLTIRQLKLLQKLGQTKKQTKRNSLLSLLNPF